MSKKKGFLTANCLAPDLREKQKDGPMYLSGAVSSERGMSLKKGVIFYRGLIIYIK